MAPGSRVIGVRVPEEIAQKIEELGAKKADVLRGLMEIAAALAEKEMCEKAIAMLIEFVGFENVGRAEEYGKGKIYVRRYYDHVDEHIVISLHEHVTGYGWVEKAVVRVYKSGKVESIAPCALIEDFKSLARALRKAISGR